MKKFMQLLLATFGVLTLMFAGCATQEDEGAVEGETEDESVEEESMDDSTEDAEATEEVEEEL